MAKGRNVLKGEVDREEERGEVRRDLVVKEKVRQRVRERAEEGNSRLEGRDASGGGAGLHGVQVNVPVVQDAQRGDTRILPPMCSRSAWSDRRKPIGICGE